MPHIAECRARFQKLLQSDGNIEIHTSVVEEIALENSLGVDESLVLQPKQEETKIDDLANTPDDPDDPAPP